MSAIEKLTEQRRKEQTIRNYPASSKWYTGLNNAINHFALAEETNNALEKFRHSWSALYNLYMMLHARGESENDALNSWSKEMQGAPAVRSVAQETPRTMLDAIQRAGNQLLWNAESKRPREGKMILEAWLARRTVSAEDACKWLLLIGRDLRNAVSHPSINPAAPNIKKALNEAAPVFFKLAEAAIRVTIEHPPAGTTGRTTAYRSFLYPYLKNSESNFSDYYLENLFEENEAAVFAEDEIKPALRGLAQQYEKLRGTLRTADAEPTRRDWLEAHLFPFLSQDLAAQLRRGVRIVAGEQVYEPSYVIACESKNNSKAPREYEGKQAGRELCCLIFALPGRVSLDAVTHVPASAKVEDETPEPLTAMELAQRALLASDVPWAVLTNGRQFRLLAKATAHKLHSFLEIDLDAVLDQYKQPAAQRAFGFFRGLFEVAAFVTRDDQGRTRLERVVRESERHGKELSDELKSNVFAALEELGEGFLDYLRRRPAELEAWRQQKAPSLSTSKFLVSDALLEDIYHESLALMYRLLFLFYAEGRDLLPMENELYRETYSLEAIRDEIIARRDDPDVTRNFFPKGETELWERLHELFRRVDKGSQEKALPIPAYNGGLFDPEKHEFLEQFKLGDYYLSRAIDLLSRTRPGSKAGGEGRKKVTYRDLDIRHLGSIYEGILEYHARITDADLAVVETGTGSKKEQEYKPVAELSAAERQHLAQYRAASEENPDNPHLPRGCKVKGVKMAGQYYLVYGGRESKRKSSGSYYTPDYIVQYIVENTLGPLVRGECRQQAAPALRQDQATLGFVAEQQQLPAGPQPLSAEEILNLKVLDPAMGSGHFLVAATEYLAKAYHAALLRESGSKEGVKEADLTRYKRLVAERCIYGVDINPMAVELAKLSMWLYTMDRGRPLSFLDHHLKRGNALIGAWIEDLGTPPGDRRAERARSRGQMNLFENEFRKRLPAMVRNLMQIMKQETLTINDIELKKDLDRAFEQWKQPFKNIADIYIGIHFDEDAPDYLDLLLDVEKAFGRNSSLGETLKTYHWELEFPEIFFDEYGNRIEQAGFDAVVGNPPYDVMEKERGDSFTPHSALSEFSKDNKRYMPALGGKLDLYRFFVIQSLNITKIYGRLGLIVPLSLLGDISCSQTRRHFLLSTRNLTADCFPQKDNPNRRIFFEAKLSTTILIGQKVSPNSNTAPSIFVKTYPWNTFDDEHRKCLIKFSDAQLIDPVNIPIPLLDAQEWELCRKIHLLPRVVRLGEVDELIVNRGEINQTIYREFITTDKTKSRLLKGVEVGRYVIKTKLSQGHQEWFDERKYLRNNPPKTIVSQQRIATQRITGVDEKRRIVAAIVDPPAYFADSTNSIYLSSSSAYKPQYILALLNSSLFQWRFKLTSTNNNVGTNEINSMPFRTITFSDKDDKYCYDQLVSFVDRIQMLCLQDANASLNNQGNLQLKIEALDKKIDELIYKLYGLTDDEISIVESALQR